MQLGGWSTWFDSIAVIRKKKFTPAQKKDGSATSDRDTTPHARQPSAFLSPTCHACGLCAAPRAEMAWQQRSNVGMAESSRPRG